MMVEVLFEVGINLLETFIIFEFLTRYLGCKYTDKRRTFGFLLFWLIGFLELCIINYITDFESFGAYIPILINFLYALIFLKGSTQLKIWASIITHAIVMVIAYITILFFSGVMGASTNDIIRTLGVPRVVVVIVSKIVLFYTTRIILRHKNNNLCATKLNIFMLVIIPCISIIALASLMKVTLLNDEMTAYITIGIGCILLANIMTYYFFTVISKEYETKLKIQLLEQQNENAKKNIENADAFIKQMKSVRHDIKNQLIVISGYLDKNKIEEAKKYINSLNENCPPNIHEYINTGNETFDAIANSKIALCTQKNIFMTVSIMEDSLNGMDAIDISILFGNILDNAIEAAEKTKSRRITVDIQTKGEYLSILVSNSIQESVLENNSRLETSKGNKESHGIGIKSIKAIVKKYDGMLQFFEEQNEFCCHILLDLNMKR